MKTINEAKPGDLILTRDEEHIYRLGNEILPNVTRILVDLGFLNLSYVSAEALYRGKYVHAVLHYLNENDYNFADCDPKFRGFIDSWIRFRDNFGDRLKIIACEQMGYHELYRYAGTLDLLCEIDGKQHVIDYKTVSKGSRAPKASKYQTGAYELLLPKLTIGYRKRGVLELHEDGSMASLVPHDDLNDGNKFIAFLTTYRERRQNRIKEVLNGTCS